MSETTIDADGFKIIGGYRVRDNVLNGRPSQDIVVSPEKWITIQELKMSEQFDLFEILSASRNPTYRNLAAMGAMTRGISTLSRFDVAAKPKLFPRTADMLKKVLDELGGDGIDAISAVQEALSPKKEEVDLGNGEVGIWTEEVQPLDAAKNSHGTPV